MPSTPDKPESASPGGAATGGASRQPTPAVWVELEPTLSRPAPLDARRDREILGTTVGEGSASQAPEATGAPAALSRRRFLQAGTLLGAAAALAACDRAATKAIPYVVPPEDFVPGQSVHYASTCQACPASCGLLVTCRDGRPIKLEGRPEHARSRGGLCAVGQADIRALYDGGRLAAPMLDGKAGTWKAVDARVAAKLTALGAGAGSADAHRVVVLSPTIVSPTTRATVEAFLAPFSGTLVEYDAFSTSAVLDAYERLDGRAVFPAYELSETDRLVTLGGDFFGAGADPVTNTRAWAERRAAADRPPPRHVHFGGAFTLTASCADERHAVRAAEQTRIALGLLELIEARLRGDTSARAGELDLPAPLAAATSALAAELLAHKGRCLIVSGADELIEQAAVALLNRALGAEGRTLDLRRPSLVRRGRRQALDAFRQALASGTVQAVFVLDANPVAELPDGVALGAALAKLPLSVALTERPTETAAACQVVAAAHHRLERWGDAMPRAGLLTLAQPTIRPLLNTRHPWECLLRWGGAPRASARAHLEAAWEAQVFAPASHAARAERGAANAAASAKVFFDACVQMGGAPDGTRYGPTQPAAPRALDAARQWWALKSNFEDGFEPAAGEFEVELIREVALREGGHAFNPWLRELADPLTRIAWQPCVRLAPSAMRDHNLSDGTLVTIGVGSASVTLPARAQPGQHPAVLAVPVGYGVSDDALSERAARHDGDREGLSAGGAGENAYRLAIGNRAGLAASLARAAGEVALPLAQWNPSTEGRPIVHQVPERDTPVPKAHIPADGDLWTPREQPSPQWHMAIDLDKCTGCSACVIACQAENNLPIVGPREVRRHRDLAWLRLDRYYTGDDIDAPDDVLFEPMLCQHCDHAPCETVCPVAATTHSVDGLNQQVYNRCIGTRYCENNCPYKVRRFNWFAPDFGEPSAEAGDARERLVLNPDVVVRSRGVMEKCSFCVQRIQKARIDKKTGGPAVLPQTACQQSCPAEAITFGDRTDAQSPVAQRRAEPRAFQVLAELGVQPSVTYLARVRNRPGIPAPGGTAAHAARE